MDKDIALEVLLDNHKFLTTAVSLNLECIANFLFGKRVLNQQLYTEVSDGTWGDKKKRASKLLLAVSEMVESHEDGKAFVLLVNALESEPAARSHAEKLVQFYSKFLSMCRVQGLIQGG